jgi:hypothetical protein
LAEVEIGSAVMHHGAPADPEVLLRMHARRVRALGYEPVGEQTIHEPQVLIPHDAERPHRDPLLVTQITGMGYRSEPEHPMDWTPDA